MKNGKKLLISALVLSMAVLMLVFTACEKKPAETTVGTTEKPGISSFPAITTAAPLTTALTTAEITTKKPAETFVSPDLSLVDFDKEVDKERDLYSNPVIFDKNDAAYFSDPFVIRYDGSYYMYSSGENNKPLYCHKSDDLVHWSAPVAVVSTDELPAGVNEGGTNCTTCMSGYAPEVVYWNGIFVLVTSPGGMGHYFFTSDSPLGPFKRASENFGCKIDGDIFIDNDGKWYFYYANGAGIQCRPMTNYTEVNTVGNAINTGSIIDEGAGGWTEGSMIIYHDGIYYMTYTGNHTARATYRVEYGISYDDPTHFTHDPDSQVFISTSNAMSGIGHSSSVKGPDLDSYYLVYHTRGMDGKGKDVNIDRIVFNGDRMTTLGPTVQRAAVPDAADINALFDALTDADKFTGTFTIEGGEIVLGKDARVMAKDDLARDTYTAEITTRNIEKDARAGVIFGYKDDNNYGSALFDTKTEELVITFTVDGKATEYREKLVRSFDTAYRFDVVQAIQVEKTGNTFTFYVNDRELCKKESTLSGLGVGMMTEGGSASFGYFGATASTGGNATKEYYKPVATQTGYILSTHCREWDIKTGIREDTKEVYLKAETGRTYNYAVFAELRESYALAACYRSEKGAVLSVFVDGVYIRDIKLSASKDIATEIIRGIQLDYNAHVITIFVREGEADIFYYRCMTSTAVKEATVDFERELDKAVKYSDSTKWTIKDSALKMSGFGKRLYGSYTMGDCIFSVDADPVMSGYKFGILMRATNPGEATFIKGSGTHNAVDTTDEGAQKGSNWVQGYYVQFTDKETMVYKLNYDKTLASTLVSSVKHSIGAGKNNFSVKAEGATLTVYINGEKILEYTDPEPYITGMAGMRCNSGVGVVFDNVKLSAID